MFGINCCRQTKTEQFVDGSDLDQLSSLSVASKLYGTNFGESVVEEPVPGETKTLPEAPTAMGNTSAITDITHGMKEGEFALINGEFKEKVSVFFYSDDGSDRLLMFYAEADKDMKALSKIGGKFNTPEDQPKVKTPFVPGQSFQVTFLRTKKGLAIHINGAFLYEMMFPEGAHIGRIASFGDGGFSTRPLEPLQNLWLRTTGFCKTAGEVESDKEDGAISTGGLMTADQCLEFCESTMFMHSGAESKLVACEFNKEVAKGNKGGSACTAFYGNEKIAIPAPHGMASDYDCFVPMDVRTGIVPLNQAVLTP